MNPSSRPPPPIPDFELVRAIDSGSYGDIWLARSVTGLWRAIKVVYRDRFQNAKPFEREFSGVQKAEGCSKTHPNLAQILHVGRSPDDSYFYYVLELADDATRGQSIDPTGYEPHTLREDLARDEILPVARCLGIAQGLAQGLAHLHQQGLVHRDIKPSNIIFVDGLPKLADFGLIALAERTSSLVGTPGYIPPEGPGRPQGDVYSLGRVLFEMTWGPSASAQFPELPADLNTLPEWPDRLRLNSVLARACDPDPGQRYQTPQEMIGDLDCVANGRALSAAGTQTSHPQPVRSTRSSRVGFALGVTFLLGCVVVPTAMIGGGGAAAGFAILGFLACVVLCMLELTDGLMRAEQRAKLGRWLTEFRSPKSAAGWSDALIRIFERWFTGRHLSWSCLGRCLAASLATNLFLLIGFYTLDPDRFFHGTAYASVWKLAPAFLVAGVLVNLLPNYLSLLKTRYLLRRMNQAQGPLRHAGLLGLDFLATTAIVLVFLGLVSTTLGRPTLQFLGLNGYFLRAADVSFFNFGIYAPVTDLASFLRQNLALRDIFGIFIYSTYLTSIWSWLFVAAAWLARSIVGLTQGLRRAQRFLGAATQPVRFVQIVTLAFCLLPGLGAYLVSRVARAEIERTAPSSPKLCPVTGILLMPIPEGKYSRRDAGGARYPVELSGFLLGQTEVTQAQWSKVMEQNPSYHRGPDLPVDAVNWDQVEEFLAKLNLRLREKGDPNFLGFEYRLPTEAQWEYACRAETDGQTNDLLHCPTEKLNDYAWTVYNSGGRPHPVRQKLPNAWNLYDMHGNVREMCSDWYAFDAFRKALLLDPPGPSQGTQKTVRGGSWKSETPICWMTSRQSYRPNGPETAAEDPTWGFRVALVRVAPPPPTASSTTP